MLSNHCRKYIKLIQYVSPAKHITELTETIRLGLAEFPSAESYWGHQIMSDDGKLLIGREDVMASYLRFIRNFSWSLLVGVNAPPLA